MTRTMTLMLLALLALAPVGLAADGDSNFTNVVASGDITAGDDLTVTDDVTVSGDLAVTGSETHDGTQTFSADITVSGNGTDILFNTANQNSIGGATKGAKEVFARALTGETGTALTISAGSGITVSSAPTISADTTLSGNGVDLLFNAANQNSIGGSTKGAKEIFARALTGETGTALTISASSGVTVSSTSTHSADMTMSGSGIDLLFNTANQNSIGAAATGAKEVFTRAVTGETGTALTISAGSGITVSSATTINAALTVTGTSTHSGRLTVGTIFPGGGCPDSASAATWAPTESCHNLTGGTNVTTITTGNFTDGDILTIISDANSVVEDGNDINLAGSSWVGGATDSITLLYMNQKFHQLASSDN